MNRLKTAACVFACIVVTAAAFPQDRSHQLGSPAAPEKTPGAIRIATYNILNFFDGVDDPSLQGEFDDIKMTTSNDRVRSLARAIRQLDADIIALQEVESLEALKSFRDEFLSDMGYKYLASYDVGYYRGIECSVMSRFEITDARVWPNMSLDNVRRAGQGWDRVPSDTSLTFQRSPLVVKVKIRDDYELTIFSIHHKAGRDNKFHREAEAIRINEFIDAIEAEDPGANIVVMGDFNAAPWDKSVRVYLANGLVDTMAHRTTHKDEPESRLYKTHASDRVIDYILMNAAAYNEYIPGTGFVLSTLRPPHGWNWRTDPEPPGYASDHYPLAVEIVPRDRN